MESKKSKSKKSTGDPDRKRKVIPSIRLSQKEAKMYDEFTDEEIQQYLLPNESGKFPGTPEGFYL